MTTIMQDMKLAERAELFAALLRRCQITGKAGVAHELEAGLMMALRLLGRARARHNGVYVVGNGGSAAIASHIVNDLVNVGRLRATTIHDPSLLTCMSNDYGYENAFARILERMVQPGDLLIAVSSSGRSMNIRNAVLQVTSSGGTAITLSGFAPDNPLRTLGDLNIWLDSNDYGMVEQGHQFVLHTLSDRLSATPPEAP